MSAQIFSYKTRNQKNWPQNKTKEKNPESFFAFRSKPVFECSCVPDRAQAHVFHCNSF